MFVRDAEKKRLHLVYFEQISPKTQPFFFNRLFVLTVVVEKTKTQALGGFSQNWKTKGNNSKFYLFQGNGKHCLIFIAKYVQKQEFCIKNPKYSKLVKNVSRIEGEIYEPKQEHKTQGKTSSFGRISPRLRDQVVL